MYYSVCLLPWISKIIRITRRKLLVKWLKTSHNIEHKAVTYKNPRYYCEATFRRHEFRVNEES